MPLLFAEKYMCTLSVCMDIFLYLFSFVLWCITDQNIYIMQIFLPYLAVTCHYILSQTCMCHNIDEILLKFTLNTSVLYTTLWDTIC